MRDKPVISAFCRAPDFAKGRVRDLRIRWAFEELGLHYDTHLLDAMSPRDEDYLRWQPFGQVPALRDGEVAMFESGAILLYLAQRHGALLPEEPQARWQAVSWLFAALNSMEPPLMMLPLLTLVHGDEPWSAEAQAAIRPFVAQRFQRLGDALGEREWLAGTFSIADIAMASLFLIGIADLAAGQPRLAAYRDRAFARPAHQRARAAQLADFVEDAPTPMEGA